MKLFDILKQHGLFVNEIKSMIKNRQILINFEPASENVDLSVRIDENSSAIIMDCGDFLQKIIKSKYVKDQPNIFTIQLQIFGLEGLVNTNIKNELSEILKPYIFIRLSKKETIVLIQIPPLNELTPINNG